MTNYEKYREEFKEVIGNAYNGDSIGRSKNDGALYSCNNIACSNCTFSTEGKGGCFLNMLDWCMKEYDVYEDTILTEGESALIAGLKDGIIHFGTDGKAYLRKGIYNSIELRYPFKGVKRPLILDIAEFNERKNNE